MNLAAAQRIVSAVVVVGGLGLLLGLETIRPLRRAVEPKLRRVVRNLATGGISLAVLSYLQTPILTPISWWTVRHNVGLLNTVSLPSWVRTVLAVLLLDYTLWFWHWGNHRIPFLWRFHLVHHVDLDLDASTALRFHFGELTLSIAFRALQIVAIGAGSESLWIWQTLLFASILFHHSNLRLPVAIERRLVRIIVTPRMHGIHHSDRPEETNSNWSSLLSCWDYLHRTVLLNVAQEAIRIGVPAYEDPRDITIGKILALPFLPRRDDWRGADGELSTRAHDPDTRAELMA